MSPLNMIKALDSEMAAEMGSVGDDLHVHLMRTSCAMAGKGSVCLNGLWPVLAIMLYVM